ALMHDIVVFPKNDLKNRVAPESSALLAKEILQKIDDYPSDKIGKVLDLIRCCSYTKNNNPKNLELKILQDADRIEAVGAIGISRAMAVCGQLGIRLCDPSDPLSLNSEPDRFKNCLDFFVSRLLGLEEKTNTDSGKKIIRERVEYIKNFL